MKRTGLWNVAVVFGLSSLVYAGLALAQAAADPAASLTDPLAFLKLAYKGIIAGDFTYAAAALAVAAIAGVRVGGPWLHEKLPDNVIWDKPLSFLFDTKPGGWLLNFMTVSGGGVGSALLLGAWPHSSTEWWVLLKPILGVSAAATQVFHAVEDFWKWWKERKAKKAAESVAMTPAGGTPAAKP